MARAGLRTPSAGRRRLNQVERWFALLTQKQIRRGVHRSTRALEAAEAGETSCEADLAGQPVSEAR